MVIERACIQTDVPSLIEDNLSGFAIAIIEGRESSLDHVDVLRRMIARQRGESTGSDRQDGDFCELRSIHAMRFVSRIGGSFC